jgi:hypothetical protein
MAEAAKKAAAKTASKTTTPAKSAESKPKDPPADTVETQKNEATGNREEPVNLSQPDETAGTAAQVVQGNGVGQSFVDVPDEVEAYTPPKDAK